MQLTVSTHEIYFLACNENSVSLILYFILNHGYTTEYLVQLVQSTTLNNKVTDPEISPHFTYVIWPKETEKRAKIDFFQL